MVKKTRWFPCSIKPVRPGLYEVQLQRNDCENTHSPAIGLYRFNGGRWRWCVNGNVYNDRVWSIDEGPSVGETRPGLMPLDRWRGLAK